MAAAVLLSCHHPISFSAFDSQLTRSAFQSVFRIQTFAFEFLHAFDQSFSVCLFRVRRRTLDSFAGNDAAPSRRAPYPLSKTVQPIHSKFRGRILREASLVRARLRRGGYRALRPHLSAPPRFDAGLRKKPASRALSAILPTSPAAGSHEPVENRRRKTHRLAGRKPPTPRARRWRLPACQPMSFSSAVFYRPVRIRGGRGWKNCARCARLWLFTKPRIESWRR